MTAEPAVGVAPSLVARRSEIRDAVDIHFRRGVEELVDEDRRIRSTASTAWVM